MKKTNSIVFNLLLASTLFAGAYAVEADELVMKEVANASAYCHMKFPPMREDTLGWERPVLDHNAGNIIDFYGPCDHDPTGLSERTRQRRHLHRDND
jgi:hypothetical protein